MTEQRDAIGRRNRLYPSSTGKRVTPTKRDLAWFSMIHEHGPLPSSYLHNLTGVEWRSEKRAKERLTDLFNEANTPHGGPYLTRPLQQFRTIDSRYNELVYDLAPAAEKALKEAGLWRLHAVRPTGPWLHAHMVACITASIELATRGRSDLSYIPGWRVLERAGAVLRYPVTIAESSAKHPTTRDLIPDALFGLEYHTDKGSRFRFFVVEADRATEPLRSGDWGRKSFLRSLAQYHAYIESGVYRKHLNLTAPLLVLNMATSEARARKMIEVAERFPSGWLPYQLFQTWEEFGGVWRPQRARSNLLIEPWLRAGSRGVCIGRV